MLVPAAARRQCSPRLLLAAVALAALLLLAPAGWTGSARAATAYFPNDVPPPTQITRELTLNQAAQAGVLKLEAKGGGEGDAVQLELDGTKKVAAPILVTVRAEVTVPLRLPADKRALIREFTPDFAKQTELDLNRNPYKTRSGDPIRFAIEFQYREPESLARPGYHQIRLINPELDLPSDPDFRAEVERLVPPNEPGPTGSVWTFNDLVPTTMAHETLHLVGLNDRYMDVYVYKGQKIPLPDRGMPPKELKKFLASHKPPLPPPPKGRVEADDTPGTDKCDVMGSGSDSPCRKLSKRDLEWIESQAGLSVTANPGEVLLDKASSKQNFGVAFKTVVVAKPGQKTVAPGVAVYCLDHDRSIPIGELFDVGPPAAELAGYSEVNKLLQLNAVRQPTLALSIEGMQAAIWNLTDASPLATSGTAEQSRQLMAAAGVAEDSIPGGLPAIANPNAAAPTTGAVNAAGAVLPPIPSLAATPPPPLRIYTAALFPRRLHSGGRLYADLLLGASGEVSGVTMRLQRKAGKRWRKLKTLAARKFSPGTKPLQLPLGRLPAGNYRILVGVEPPFGDAVVRPVPFKVS